MMSLSLEISRVSADFSGAGVVVGDIDLHEDDEEVSRRHPMKNHVVHFSERGFILVFLSRNHSSRLGKICVPLSNMGEQVAPHPYLLSAALDS